MPNPTVRPRERKACPLGGDRRASAGRAGCGSVSPDRAPAKLARRSSPGRPSCRMTASNRPCAFACSRWLQWYLQWYGRRRGLRRDHRQDGFLANDRLGVWLGHRRCSGFKKSRHVLGVLRPRGTAGWPGARFAVAPSPRAGRPACRLRAWHRSSSSTPPLRRFSNTGETLQSGLAKREGLDLGRRRRGARGRRRLLRGDRRQDFSLHEHGFWIWLAHHVLCNRRKGLSRQRDNILSRREIKVPVP